MHIRSLNELFLRGIYIPGFDIAINNVVTGTIFSSFPESSQSYSSGLFVIYSCIYIYIYIYIYILGYVALVRLHSITVYSTDFGVCAVKLVALVECHYFVLLLILSWITCSFWWLLVWLNCYKCVIISKCLCFSILLQPKFNSPVSEWFFSSGEQPEQRKLAHTL